MDETDGVALEGYSIWWDEIRIPQWVDLLFWDSLAEKLFLIRNTTPVSFRIVTTVIGSRFYPEVLTVQPIHIHLPLE